MRVYDEDAFFGSGEYEVRTVAEILEHLTEEEKSIFNNLCDRAEKRRRKAETRSKMFSRGYEEARGRTNSYNGHYTPQYYEDMSGVEEVYNDFIQQSYLGG